MAISSVADMKTAINLLRNQSYKPPKYAVFNRDWFLRITGGEIDGVVIDSDTTEFEMFGMTIMLMDDADMKLAYKLPNLPRKIG